VKVDAGGDKARGSGMRDVPIQVGKPCRWCGKRDDHHPFWGLLDGTALCPECRKELAQYQPRVQWKPPGPNRFSAVPTPREAPLLRPWRTGLIAGVFGVVTIVTTFLSSQGAVVTLLVGLGAVAVSLIRNTLRARNMHERRLSDDPGGTGGESPVVVPQLPPRGAETAARDDVRRDIYAQWPNEYPPDWEWRSERVRCRDGNRCRKDWQDCSNLYLLHAHHIKRVADGGNHTPENLKTLCLKHHAQQPGHELLREKLFDYEHSPEFQEKKERLELIRPRSPTARMWFPWRKWDSPKRSNWRRR
jgi:hypothetical protein